MSKTNVWSEVFTDIVLIASKKEEKGWRETKISTYVGKRDEKYYEIIVADDDNTYKGQSSIDVSSHEISQEDYLRISRTRK